MSCAHGYGSPVSLSRHWSRSTPLNGSWAKGVNWSSALTYLTLTLARHLAKSNPMRRLVRNRPRGYSLLLIRRHAEAGLLRDGGMTAAQVCRYIQELRREVAQEITLRIRKQVPSLVS